MTGAGTADPQSLASRARAGLLAIPGVRLVRTYDRSWLPTDALAALTVWALLVPQALAYAQLGGFDPVVGLYAAIGALAGYALLGGVREMNVGPEATIALLTASVIAPLAGGDPARYLAFGAGVALVAGILLMLAGLARLGFVTRYLSRPLLTGYVAGSAIVMIISQLDSLLGLKLVATDDPIAELVETIRRIPEADPLTLAVGLAVIAIALGVRRLDKRLPAYLIAVLAAIVLSVVLELEAAGCRGRRDGDSRAAAVRAARARSGRARAAGHARGRHRPAHLRRQRGQRPGPRATRRLPGRRGRRVPGARCRQHRGLAHGRLPGQRQPVAQLHGGRRGRPIAAGEHRRAAARPGHPAVPHAAVRAPAEGRPRGRDHRRGGGPARPGRVPQARPDRALGGGPGGGRDGHRRGRGHARRRGRRRHPVAPARSPACRPSADDIPRAGAGHRQLPRARTRRRTGSPNPASSSTASTLRCSSPTRTSSATTSRPPSPPPILPPAGSSSTWSP